MEVTKLIPNQWYCVTVSEACTITAKDGTGFTQTLKECSKAGQYMVKTISDKLTIDDDDHALVEGPFKVAPTGGLGGGEFDGHLNGSLYVGNGNEPAVAAVCTLTLGDPATGGTLTDSNGQSVELETPHTYAVGTVSIADATAAGTLSIGEWSRTWEAAPGARAAGWLQLAAGAGTFLVNGVVVNNPENYTDVEAWNAMLEPCGVFCTDEAIELGSPKINIAAIEYGEAGNSITLEAVGEYFSVSGPTLTGGANGRTLRDVYNDILEDADCPVDVTLDADELGLSFTAREYGVNDAISAEGDMFSNWSGMSGGHGDYTVAELVSAIAGEFEDITPTAGEVEGTITLTANEAGAAANAITYTASGCFGSGTVKQGSTTRGKNAVEQTAFKIYLNGEEFTGGSVTIDPAPTQGSTNAVSSGGVYSALQGKQNSLTAGDGISLTGGTIAVDASGAVAAGDTLPVSGDTVGAALDGYLPLKAGVAPEVKGNVTFSGTVLVASNSLNTKYNGKNIFFGGAHKNAPIGSGQGIYLRGVDQYSTGGVCFQLGNTYVNNFYIGMTNSYAEGMGTSGMAWRRQNSGGTIPNDKCFVLAVDRALSFGETSTETALRGKTLELRVCDQTDTTGASDTVLTLDAAKLQKLIDFIDTL